MTIVNNQDELRAAITAQDSAIQVDTDITLTSPLVIRYAVVISSTDSANVHTIFKDASFFGNMFSITNGGSLTFRNITVDGNAENHPSDNSANRSIVSLAGGTLTLDTGAVLQNNNAYTEGGAVYMSGSANYTNALVMRDNAKVTGCYSRTSGGGIMAALRNNGDSVSITGRSVISNNRGSSGAGLYFRSYLEGVEGNLTLGDNVQFKDNRAAGNGGGVYCSNFISGNTAPLNLTINNAVNFTNNTAGGYGGGLYYMGTFGGDSVSLSGGANFTQNSAVTAGGGIYMIFQAESAANAEILDITLEDNSAGSGGGLYFQTQNGGKINLSGTQINSNTSTNVSNGHGGGIYIINNSTDKTLTETINKVNLKNNSSAYQGGAIYINDKAAADLTFSGNTINENTAGSAGGGISAAGAGGAISFNGNTISGNIAAGNGGGAVCTNSGTSSLSLRFIGDMIIDNKSGNEGGGLRISGGSGGLNAVIQDADISGNISSDVGGGVWAAGTNTNLSVMGTTSIYGNATVNGNGGGVYFNTPTGMLNLRENAKVNQNSADGGSGIINNGGGGVYLAYGAMSLSDSVEIKDNKARRNGGGINARDGAVINMLGGTIDDNTSGQFGGGVYLKNSSVLNFSNGSINGNKANTGGGIYNESNSVVYISESASIGDETPNSSVLAPGIYNSAKLRIMGTRDIENGVYIANDVSSVPMLDSTISPNSKIQLNNSPYLSPNPEGIPIVVGEAAGESYPVLSQADADAFIKPPAGFEDWEIRLSDDRTKIILARIVHTITYLNTMGAYNPNPATFIGTSPDIVLQPLAGPPGYQFVGWFTEAAGGTPVTVIPTGTSEDITLYAHWEIIIPWRVLTFEPNDAGGPPAENIPPPIQIANADEVWLPGNVPVRKGYTFAGWNIEADGSGMMYRPGQYFGLLTMDIVLYAIWQPNSSSCCCRCCCKKNRTR